MEPSQDDTHFYHLENIIKLEETYFSDEFDIAVVNTIKVEDLECINEPEQSLDKIDHETSHQLSLNEFNLLEQFLPDDRNVNGTVKMEAIERLGLDSWASVQFRCYICLKELYDFYELRIHMNAAHRGNPVRHFCNICNLKHYAKRKSLRNHIISMHRRYFKLW